MFVQIFQFLLEVIGGLIAGACLLRLYMQLQRVPFSNPIGQLVFALSDWLVLPLRRLITVRSHLDIVCLLAAALVLVVQYALWWLVLGGASSVILVPLLAFFGLLRLVLTGLMGILIVYAIFSWVQPQSPLAGVFYRLSEPLLRPLRKFIPLMGGLDLSALVALIILQVLQMILAHLQMNALAGVAVWAM